MTYLETQDKNTPETSETASVSLPDYLRETYTWAYLNPKTVPFLSSAPVVSAILWGNANRLIKRSIAEITPGQSVLQTAAVYGKFSCELARAVGKDGRLDIIDVAPIQVETTKKRVADFGNTTVMLGDASIVRGKLYDTIVCFFLLHEVPDDVKGRIVNALLASLKPQGKLVFVDYHKPLSWHPLKPLMSKIFDWLEPFAKGLWDREIQDFALNGQKLDWQKETLFGGLYQKVVVRRLSA